MIITNILTGTFKERPNRFTVKFNKGHETELAHLRDPGRLKELLTPDAELLIRPAQNWANRKTKFDILAVLYEDRWVLINSGFHSDIAADLIENKMVDGLNDYFIEKREYKYGKSRLDFLLKNSKSEEKLLLEVKGCTLVEDGLAKFPDAPTIRGKKHVEELIKAKEEGINSAVLFLILRDDASHFSPNWVMDPEFSKVLTQAYLAGVMIHAYSFKIESNGKYLVIKPFKSVNILWSKIGNIY